VERVEGTLTGSVALAWTSVETSRIEPVSGRHRINISLQGFLLEPIEDGRSTRVVHVLQVTGSSFLPRAFVSQMLTRRALCIAKIRDDLEANGPPTPLQVSKPPSTASRRSTLLSAMAPVPADIVEEEAPSAPVDAAADVEEEQQVAPPRTEEEDAVGVEFDKTLARLKKVESRPAGELESVVDYHARSWLVHQKDGIVRSEARVEGVTVEQVLGTLMSRAARRICKAF
jgi:hypothetical protein